MDAVLAALPAGVVCVTFLIGFANLRIHAERQRAIQRSDDIAREITHVTGQATIRDEDVEATSASLSEAMRIDPVAEWTLYAASFVSITCLLLLWVQAESSHWKFQINPVNWSTTFLALLSMPVFSIVVAGLGWADYRWVIRDLRERRANSFMEVVREAMVLRRSNRHAQALARVDTLAPSLNRWPWLAAFRSNCLEHLGELEEAIQLALTASTLAPENGWYKLLVARLLWEQENVEDALNFANQAVEQLPAEPGARGLRGVILDRIGRSEDALADLEVALKDSPADVLLVRARGSSLVRSNLTEFSTRTLEQIIGENNEILIAALRARAHMRLDQQRELEQAKSDLDLVLSAKPDDREAISYHALACALLDDEEAAQKDISKFDKAPSPDSRAGLIEIAQALYLIKRYDDAIGKLTKYLGYDPKSRDALHWRAMAYEEIGQITKAIEDYEQRLRHASDDYHFLIHHGTLMMEAGLGDVALRDFNEAIILAPHSVYGRGNRGTALATMGRYEEAFEDFDDIVRTTPGNETALVDRARVADMLGRSEEALADLRSAETINAADPRVYVARGIIYLRKERTSEALQELTHAVELDPKYVIARANRGVAEDRLRLYPEALADFEEAIRLAPTIPRFYIQHGCINFRRGNKLEAIRDYNKALKISPTDSIALVHRGEWYMNAGQLKEAIEDLEKAYAEKPSDPEIAIDLAIAHAKLGDAREVQELARRIVEDSSIDDDSLRSVGYAMNNAGMAADSLTIFERLISSNPQSIIDLLAYGIALRQIDNVEGAVELFKRLLQQDRKAAQEEWDKLVNPTTLFRYEAVASTWRESGGRVDGIAGGGS